MGTQARSSSCQLRTQRVCHMGEIGGYLHRSNAIRLGMLSYTQLRFAFSYFSLGTPDPQLMSDVYIQRS